MSCLPSALRKLRAARLPPHAVWPSQRARGTFPSSRLMAKGRSAQVKNEQFLRKIGCRSGGGARARLSWIVIAPSTGSGTALVEAGAVAKSGDTTRSAPSRRAGAASRAPRWMSWQQSSDWISGVELCGSARGTPAASLQQQVSTRRPIMRQKYWLRPRAPAGNARSSTVSAARTLARAVCILFRFIRCQASRIQGRPDFAESSLADAFV
jgi:hypothetical protein